MLHFDPVELLERQLADDRRPPDGLLHPSGDLIGSLRHAQLRAAGAPTVASEIVSDVRLMTGTMWHSFYEATFRRAKLPVMTEVKLDRWLPEGWSGTADWLMWSDEYKAFVLGDLKTIKGEGMPYVERDGIKDEHLWQLSAYWYACEAMGIPLVKAFVVLYLPQNVPAGENPQPLLAEGRPLDRELVIGTMQERWQKTSDYLDELWLCKEHSEDGSVNWLQPSLAPEQERVQILRWNGKQGVYDVKLAPHWSTAYCPYPNELCACSEQGTNKIGHFKLNEGVISVSHKSDGQPGAALGAQVEYVPRKTKDEDYSDIELTVTPPSVKTFKEKLNG